MDGFMVCDRIREGILEYFAFLDKGDMVLGNRIIVKDRIRIWILEEGVGSVSDGGYWEETINNDKFKGIYHV